MDIDHTCHTPTCLLDECPHRCAATRPTWRLPAAATPQARGYVQAGQRKIQRSRNANPAAPATGTQSRGWRQQTVRAGMHRKRHVGYEAAAALSGRLHLRKAPRAVTTEVDLAASIRTPAGRAVSIGIVSDMLISPGTPRRRRSSPRPSAPTALAAHRLRGCPSGSNLVLESLPVKIGGMRLITVPISLPMPGATAGSSSTACPHIGQDRHGVLVGDVGRRRRSTVFRFR